MMISRWGVLIKKCLLHRADPATFSLYVSLLRKDEDIENVQLCSLILSRASLQHGTIDPLISTYLEVLLIKEQVKPYDALQALVHARASTQASEDHDTFTDVSNRLTIDSILDHSILVHLAQQFLNNDFRLKPDEYASLFKTMGAWMNALIAQSEDVVVSATAASSQELSQAALISRQSFCYMMLTCLANQHTVSHLKGDNGDDDAKPIAEALTPFVSLVTQTDPDMAQKLQYMQREYQPLQLSDKAKLERGNDNSHDIGQARLESIVDSEPANTRASFFVHLAGLLMGRPNTSEAQVLGYLHTRYKGDAATAIIDLITACFDLLSAAMSNNENADDSFLLRSFIANRAPSIVLLLASTGFVTMNCEMLVSQAFARFEPSLFTSLPQPSFLGSHSSLLFESKQHFLAACALYNVISLESVQQILGEPASSSIATEGRLYPHQLVEECLVDTQKLEQLLDKIQTFDGNSVARTEALSQIFQKTCESKDRLALKNICNQVSRRIYCIDAIALHSDIRLFLQPLCSLLIEWKHEDDEGEHQPIYDEFSACVLLLMAVSYRFQLSSVELGFPSDPPLWHALLHRNIIAIPIYSLSEEQNKRLSGWIGGLFESNIIGDEVLSPCPPHEFYMLLPTIFQQTVLACRVGALELSHLKSGLELLLESFVMPALVPTLLWLKNHAREHTDGDNVYIQILLKVITPHSLNGDASGMHSTIVAMLSEPLLALVQDIKRRQPASKDVDAIIEKLQKHAPYVRNRTSLSQHTNSPFGTNSNSAVAELKGSFDALCYWTVNSSMQPPTPSYSPSLIETSLRLEGARKTLYGIVDGINAQSEAGMANVALDIGAAMILSNSISESMSQTNHLTLRDALQLEHADAARVLAIDSADHARAATYVRLSRRVDTLLANINDASAQHEQQQTLPMPMADTLMPDIPLDAATAAAVGLGTTDAIGQGADVSVPEALNFDTTNADELSLNIDAALAEHEQQQGVNQGQLGDGQLQSADDDIFADLNIEDIGF